MDLIVDEAKMIQPLSLRVLLAHGVLLSTAYMQSSKGLMPWREGNDSGCVVRPTEAKYQTRLVQGGGGYPTRTQSR